MHTYEANIFAAYRVMKNDCPGVDFTQIKGLVECGEYDAAIRELGRIPFKPDPNVIPSPILVIAAEIRNAKRYDPHTGSASSVK